MDNLWIQVLRIEYGLNELRHMVSEDENQSMSLMEDVLIPVHSLKKEFFLLGQQEDADELYLIESKIIDSKLIGLKDMELQDWRKDVRKFINTKKKIMGPTKNELFNTKNLTKKIAEHLKMVAQYYAGNLNRGIYWHESILEDCSFQEIFILADPLVEAIQNEIVHGIETGRERILSGKHWFATFHFSFMKSNGKRQMKLSCDGIPFNKKGIIKKASSRFMKNLPYINYFYGFDVFDILHKHSISTVEKRTIHAGHAIGYRQIHERVATLGTPPFFRSNHHFTTLFININQIN